MPRHDGRPRTVTPPAADPLTVVCPECEAQPGDPCQKFLPPHNIVIMKFPHWQREDAAILF